MPYRQNNWLQWSCENLDVDKQEIETQKNYSGFGRGAGTY